MMHKGRIVLSRNTNGNMTTSTSHERLPLLNRDDSALTKLCDLHVYRVPHELWRDSFNNILNNSVTETVSIGIIRVPYELRLVDLREEIVQQLQLDDLLPRDFVFLRSVGRSLTTLRGKQEFQLKAKHFIPPVAFSPELYILEVTPEIREALAITEGSSQSPLSRRASPSQRPYNSSFRNGYHGVSETERSNPTLKQQAHSPPRSNSVNKYETLPQISDSSHFGQFTSSSPTSDHIPKTPPSYNPHSYQNHQHAVKDTENKENKTTEINSYTYRKGYNNYNNNNNKNNFNNNNADTDKNNDDNNNKDTNINNDDNNNKDTNKNTQSLKVEQANRTKQELVGWKQTDAVKSSPAPPHPNKSDPPPRSSDKGSSRRLDDDSGVAALSPDEDYNRRFRDDRDTSRRAPNQLDSTTFALDDLSPDDRRRRLEELDAQNEYDRQRWNQDQDERRRHAEADRRKEEEEKRQREEERQRDLEERRKREEEEKRREEEQRSFFEEEQRRQKEEEENQRNNDDMAQFPSPPPLLMSSPEPDAHAKSQMSRQQRKEEKERLLREIEQARAERQQQEKEREECVKKAKNMQHKTTNRRNDARDMWKKKYFEEKKRTAPLEENANRLRQELEALHRRLMNTLEGPKDKSIKTLNAKPSDKNNYVIQCTKLQHEIEDVQRRLENAKMKLTAEMKLRLQADTELKVIKTEVMENRLALRLARNGGQTPRTLNAAI